MASPLSVGDAILLSKLAFRLGHALTVGRGKAPHGIQEVQNQLYSLGRALDLITKQAAPASRNHPSEASGETPGDGLDVAYSQEIAVENVILNCKQTLTRLETLVKKYDGLSQDHKIDTTTRLEDAKWREGFKRNWRKFRWTMEGEELDDIKKSLSVHVAALNLLVAGQNNSRTHSIELCVNDVHIMMTEVHQWFNENLRSRQSTFNNRPDAEERNGEISESTYSFFELSICLPSDLGFLRLCPRAWFRKGWIDAIAGTPRGCVGIFECHCDGCNPGQAPRPHTELIRCSLLSISLLAQLTDSPRVWQMFCHANKVVSLKISGVRPQDLRIFHENVDILATEQIRRSLRRSSSTSSIYHSISNNGISASIVDLKSDMSQFEGSITSATFHSNGQEFIQHAIDAVQILHYRTMEGLEREDGVSGLQHQYHCELVLYILPESRQNDGACSKVMIRLERITSCVSIQELDTLRLYDVVCQSESSDESKDHIQCDYVDIACATSSVARKLALLVKAATQHLQIHYLQYPRLGESVVAQRSCADVLIDHMYLNNPEALVVFDPETSTYRLILRSSSLSSVVTMELPDTFLRRLGDGSASRSSTHLQATFVEHDSETTRIKVQLARFPQELINVPGEQMERLKLC